MKESPNISMIAAMSLNRVIGKNGKLPWHLPEELAIFTQKTMGHCVIVGRKTYESIGRALEGRTTIVISRKNDFQIPGCAVVSSLEDAINLAFSKGDDEIFIGGGEYFFEEGKKWANTIYLSTIQAEIEGDAYFPTIDRNVWKTAESKLYENIPNHRYSWIFEVLKKSN